MPTSFNAGQSEFSINSSEGLTEKNGKKGESKSSITITKNLAKTSENYFMSNDYGLTLNVSCLSSCIGFNPILVIQQFMSWPAT